MKEQIVYVSDKVVVKKRNGNHIVVVKEGGEAADIARALNKCDLDYDDVEVRNAS